MSEIYYTRKLRNLAARSNIDVSLFWHNFWQEKKRFWREKKQKELQKKHHISGSTK